MDGVNPRVDGAAEGDRQRRAPALTRDPSFRQLVIDMAQEGIAVVDPRGEVALYNASMERITGYAQSEARAGFPGALIRDPDSRREALAQIERALHGRPLDRHEWEITRKDGATRIVLASARGFSYQRRRLAIILVLDVTGQRRDQRRANAYLARLRRLSSEMVLAEERERRRIASDIHDGLGDELSLARIKAAELTSAYSTDPRLAELTRILERCAGDARALTFALAPPVLHELGLHAALEWLVERRNVRSGVQMSFSGREEPDDLTEAERILCYRSVRELLRNVVKHAGARSVAVTARVRAGVYEIEVLDDGHGFDVEAALSHAEGTGFGLFSVRERLRHLGGRLLIHSTIGSGSRVTMRLPRPSESRRV
jgi:PAS domain S-box-containing protein